MVWRFLPGSATGRWFTTALGRSYPTACAERRDSSTAFSEASSNWGGARGRSEEHGGGGGILPLGHTSGQSEARFET
jgi:hypothetical protein